MLRHAFHIALPLGLLALGGCVSTVGKVVTAPVRIAGSAVDMATTSQSEADEKRGRQMRERDEKLRKLQRQYQRHMKECDKGNRSSCTNAQDDYARIQKLNPSAAPAR